jgi:two-component system, response regulator
LLVEDNLADLKLLLHVLAKSGNRDRIAVARDGKEAIAFFSPRENSAASSISLILLDLKLPKFTGVEVLRELKRNPVSKFIPVVILSSSIQDSDLRECYELGASSYLQKPVDFEPFEKLIESMEQYWLAFNHIPPRSTTRCVQGGGEA